MIRIACILSGHRPADDQVYNSGFYFGACRHCGEALIRCAHGDWQGVPAGHRVAWKSGRHSHSLEPDFAGVLPLVHPSELLPAVPSPFISWARSIARLRRPQPAAAAPPVEESGDYRHPGLLLLAVIVGAGLRLLTGPGQEH